MRRPRWQLLPAALGVLLAILLGVSLSIRGARPAPNPVISSFSPASGPVGTAVTVFGANFDGTVEVRFGSVPAAFTVVSSARVLATVPADASTASITLATPSGEATSAGPFSLVHRRTVSLHRLRRLVVTGTVAATDGFAGCQAHVQVRIQRKVSGGWQRVTSVLTGSDGSYRARLRNPDGPFRASVAGQTLASGHACGAAISGPPPSAGADIQQLIDSSPQGTTFLLPAGTWHLHSPLVPKSGDAIIGAGWGRTVLQGANATVNGFDSRSRVMNVRVADLTVQGFDQGIRTGTGWVVGGVEATDNVIGIHMYGDYVIVRDGYIHHNGVFGVHGTASVGQQMLNSEVSYNHTDSSVSSGYAGGAKWENARGLLVQGNDIHDNHGNGLWLDDGTTGGTVTGNTLRNNAGDGLRVEISSGTLIENNVVEGNAGAAIDLFDSRDNVVRGNILSAPSSAPYVLRILGNGRKDDAGVEYVNADNLAEGNTVTIVTTGQRVGVVRSGGTTDGNKFDSNTYHVPWPDSVYFSWWDGSRMSTVTWSTWTGTYGQDVNGSILSP